MENERESYFKVQKGAFFGSFFEIRGHMRDGRIARIACEHVPEASLNFRRKFRHENGMVSEGLRGS